ncbi:MAG: sugar lactone lactonase YvrE [Hyphomicrobiaceae bacterium]|jgi:sugar lactone lactonase YvrE
MTRTTRTLVDDLAFGEGPRWHDDQLWFSDMHSMVVQRVGLDGNVQTVVEVPGRPSGLGWLPDGRLLVVSMEDRRLLRLDDDGLNEVADLSSLAKFHCNDMVVDLQGRAYVGNFGFDLYAEVEPCTTELILVTPDGKARVAADDLAFPNGAVITPDAQTLIIGETYGARLTAFDIADDGSLSNRRVWAQLDGAVPDGICLDAEGAIWLASPISNECLRVAEGGEILDRVTVEKQAFACMLGGDDGCTLFICVATSGDPSVASVARDGRIEMVQVDVPGAGIP